MSSDATITPSEGSDGCEETGCGRTNLLAEVDPASAPSRVLCPVHRVEYLREVCTE